jgi:flagellar hook protein FlgE
MALNAIYTAVTGLQTDSEYLDIIGNNLANQNTNGFKAQFPEFQDLVYQTLLPGSAPTANLGAVNPSQVGFGTGIGNISSDFQQGTLNPTGNSLDMGIQGLGFFVLANPQQTVFSRAGAFNIDPTGFLVDPSTGMRVQRFGSVGETGTAAFQIPGDENIRIPLGAGIPGVTTANVTMQGNLSATLAVGDSATTAIQVFDTQSTARSLNLTFTKTAANTFSVSATISGGTVTFPPTPVVFDNNGVLVSPASLAMTFNGLPGPQTVNLQLGTPGQTIGLTQFGGPSTMAAINQDGSASGSLTAVSVDLNGVLQGAFTNGLTEPLAQLALAQFNNQSGLIRQGQNYFTASPASGVPLIGTASTGARGTVQGGTLEQSNVDIAKEFSQMILAQTGFEVNSRVVTVSNQVLQDLTAIIR